MPTKSRLLNSMVGHLQRGPDTAYWDAAEQSLRHSEEPAKDHLKRKAKLDKVLSKSRMDRQKRKDIVEAAAQKMKELLEKEVKPVNPSAWDSSGADQEINELLQKEREQERSY